MSLLSVLGLVQTWLIIGLCFTAVIYLILAILHRLWKRWYDKQPKRPLTMHDILGKDYPNEKN